jgi:hypothetical protein
MAASWSRMGCAVVQNGGIDSLQDMQKFVVQRQSLRGKVVMAKLDGVADNSRTRSFVDGFVAAIVVKDRSNVISVMTVEVPRTL